MKNVFFTNVVKRGNNLMVRSVDPNTKERLMETIPFEPSLYTPSNNLEEAIYKGIRGETLKKVTFGTMREADEYVERYKGVDGFRVFGQKDYSFQYLAQKYGKGEEVWYDASLIRKFFWDIEVFSGDEDAAGNPVAGPFPEPAEALYPINACTIYDSFTDTFFAFGLEYWKGRHLGTWAHDPSHPKIGNLKIKYMGFKDEASMLKAILGLWKIMSPDLHTGWNSESFDTTYFCNRVKLLLGKDALTALSPWGIVKERTFTGNFGREETTFDFLGVSNLDYKPLCEKHGFFEPDNWKLNTVGALLVGEEKESYEDVGSLNTLYLVDYSRLITYNIQDVNLVRRIDQKKNLLNLVFALAYLMRCNYEDTLATVRPWSSFAYIDLMNNGIQPEIRSLYQGDINFVGGFVKEPKPGKKKWIVSVDFNSLYPHIMMALNLGPETILTEQMAYMMRQELIAEVQARDDIQLQTKMRLLEAFRNNKSIHEWYFEDPVEFHTLKKHNLAMAPNLSFYKRDQESLWRRIMYRVYSGRKRVKKEMLHLEQELVNMKENAVKPIAAAVMTQILDLENAVTGKDSLQHGYKIAMNSCYGATSNRYFLEYFDIRVAEAITTMGQVAIQFGGHKINEYFGEMLGMQGHDFVITQDTDSAYIELDEYVKHKFPQYADGKDLSEEAIAEITDHLSKYFEEVMEPLFEKWFDDLSNSLNCYENKFVFKREIIAPVGIWTAKKRYACLVKDSEGVRYPKLKMKYVGLEAKKSSTPGHCRKWLVECYEIAMLKTEADIHERIKGIRAEFMQKPVEDIAAPRTANNLENFLESDGTYKKGAPKHVKAALNHNKLVSKLKLNVQPINSGDKIKFVELKRNPYGFETIGFSSFLPREMDMDKYVDRALTFDKNFISPMQVFLDAIKWNTEPKASIMDFWA